MIGWELGAAPITPVWIWPQRESMAWKARFRQLPVVQVRQTGQAVEQQTGGALDGCGEQLPDMQVAELEQRVPLGIPHVPMSRQ